MIRRNLIALGAAVAGLAALPAGASAGEEILGKASYADMSTYSCRTDSLPIVPGQNLNLFAGTTTCPNAVKVSGPGPANPFTTNEQGYVTRFKPSMVEVDDEGDVIGTPSVYDLHLHHVVWLKGNIRFASGEEKTEVKLPQGYGFQTAANAGWSLNYMIHSLNASANRQVQITWEIDWTPVASTSGASISPATIEWLDVAGAPQIYPVFDAERGYDTDDDGDFVFPDDADETAEPANEEEGSKISGARNWTVPAGGRTLVFGAGHLHPGGTSVDIEVARDGGDDGTIDGDDPSEVKPLFHSDARYYEPAGAVSWDVSMKATRPEWRVSLKEGDTVSVNATYDVEKASWYESMGIMPLAVTTEMDDPLAKDPFDDADAVQAMYDADGILTHGQLPENVDAEAGDDLGLPNPVKLKSKGKLGRDEVIDIDGFRYQTGGYSAFENFPASSMRPPLVKRNEGVNFLNTESLPGQPDNEQAWHSITSCKAPCNRGSGIGYPLADGPIKFDSGQLGFGTNSSAGGGILNFNSEVTTGTNEYETPPLTKAGKTYTYFCRIHPFMRGSVRVKEPNKN
jgi:hypothetical protein